MSTPTVEEPCSGSSKALPPGSPSSTPTLVLPPLGRTKRLVFSAITLILGWLFCETGSYAIYWFWFGQPFSWSQLQDLRRGPRAERPDGSLAALVSAVHPYVGYVEEPGSESDIRRSRQWQATTRFRVRICRRQDADSEPRAG